jgi:hypothetical protein
MGPKPSNSGPSVGASIGAGVPVRLTDPGQAHQPDLALSRAGAGFIELPGSDVSAASVHRQNPKQP